MQPDHDTIFAPATATGGAIAVIRISGDEAFTVCDRIFCGRTPLAETESHTVHYGLIVDGERTVDDVLTTVFRAPHSYTGENSVEISCHGSAYIVSEILRLLLAAGGRMAAPGEFTLRAYFAGKLDLSQAEAVADMIASSSRAAHALASNQMRGGYSAALDTLRDRLLHLASLLELELDFSEEDVEFADRGELQQTMEHIDLEIERLRNSFALGNALKEGIPVTIVGAPNAGKSTLLNRLLDEERAIVSEIAERPATSSKKQSISKESVSGSSTRPASVRPTTGWSAWASNVRCSALPKPVSLSAYSTSRRSPPRHLCVPSIRFRLPTSRYRKAPRCSRSQTKSTFIQSLFYRKGLSVCPLKTDKGLIHSVAPCYKQSEAMRSNRVTSWCRTVGISRF